MARASFWQQLKALLKRNLLLKRRNRQQTIQEFLMPIYFILILAGIKALTSPKVQPAITETTAYSFNDSRLAINTSKILYISPDDANTRDVASRLAFQLGLTSVPGYKTFATPAESETGYRSNAGDVLAGIDFSGTLPQHLNYTIRVPSEAVASTSSLYSGPASCRNTDGIDTSLTGCAANTYLAAFSKIQLLLDTILIQMRASPSLNVTAPTLSVQLMPKGDYKSNTSVFQILSSIYFVLAYSPFVSFLTVNLLYEKEKKIKEAMRMMGMRDSAFWLSWGLIYTVIIAIVTAFVVLIAFAVSFFTNSNFFLFYLMLILYGMSIVNISFMFTPFFSRAETGGALASLATVLLSLLYMVVFFTKDPITQEPTIPVPAIFALCLLSPFTLALSIDRAVMLDIGGTGMNFSTLNQGVFPLSYMLIMLTVDVVLYALLAFYLDNVIPNDHGLRRPPWFFLMPSYWCPRRAVPSDEVHLMSGGFGNTDHPTATLDTGHIEAIPQAFRNKAVLRTYNICKTFKKDKKEIKAVRGITLDICEGQITALLGHNGAGKTTLIHMLTGMSPPTEGSATIYGLDVSDSAEMTELRTMIGLCPQHNILFDDLTVREQLDFYANLKGVDPQKIPRQVTDAFNMVDLKDQADTISKQLSGGQKRKLCVAIALIGDPKVVFLDEPTAGMDPSSRRHLWKLLKEQQKDKLILLTTHFMDEADILADRKAIISKGKLQTVGSSLFLKNRFGIGYHLNTVLEPSADVAVITDLVKGHVPEAEVQRHHGKELTFTLPITSVNTFPQLFGSLEEKVAGGVEKSAQLGIHTYGISMTSLEEVFLKLGEEAEAEEEEEERKRNPNDKINGDQGHINYGTTVVMDNGTTSSSVEIRPESPDLSTLITGSALTKQRVKALMKLKLFLVLKNPGKFFLSIIFPLIYVIGASAMLKFIPVPQPATPVRLQMQPSMYANTSTNRLAPNMVMNTTEATGTKVSSFEEGIQSQSIVLQSFSSVAGLASTGIHFLGLFVTDVSTTSQVVNSAMNIVYNDSAVHSIPATINAVSSALLNMTGVLETITTYSKPWPWLSAVQSGFNGAAFSSSIFFGIAIAIIPTAFAIQMVIDREIKAKSQLRLAGVKMNMYWGTTFAFDAIQYYIVCLLMLVVVLAFQIASFTTGGAILCLLLVFIVYVPSNMLANYNISYLFDKYTTAGSTIPNLASWISMIPFMAVAITDMSGQPDVAVAMHYVFTFVMPPYSVIGAFYYIDRLYNTARIVQGSNPVIPVADYFKFSSAIPVTIIAPILQIVLLYFLLRLNDVLSNGGQWKDCMSFGGKPSSVGAVPTNNDDIPADEDGDVSKERERVKESENSSNVGMAPVVRVKNLRKEFSKDQKKGCCKRQTAEEKTRVAVRNSSFLVEPGEVLGLLGPNGAGKTTTLNMVIAEMGPTRGKVEVAGHDIRSNVSAAFQGMGYCPQHDAVWEYITLRQHLECYAAIRGIPSHNIKSVSDYFMASLDIKEHADKIAKNLSGGTKRKLSYIISMLGDPKVVLMDEPSTGMDPKSKRFLWDTISEAFNNDYRGALLTTHYMDEADALCSRVAIMINGQIECIGSTQHLKNKFGGGYHLEVKLQSSETTDDNMEALHRYVEAAFPGVVRQEAFGDRALYSVPQANIVSLSDTFNKLEQCKRELAVEEYSFSQATLEQVFLQFAKNQLDEGETPEAEAVTAAANTRSLHRQLSVQQNAATA